MLESSWKSEPQVTNYLHQTWLWASLWGFFFLLMDEWCGRPSLLQAVPSLTGGTGVYKKTNRQARRSKPVSSAPSWSLLLLLFFLSWYLGFPWWVLIRTYKPNKSFLSPVDFGHGAYQNNRKKARTQMPIQSLARIVLICNLIHSHQKLNTIKTSKQSAKKMLCVHIYLVIQKCGILKQSPT